VVQFGGADDRFTTLLHPSGFDKITTVEQFGDIDQTTKVRGFQGAGNSGQVIVRKLAGVEPGGTFLVFNNIVQNPSFENNLSRWATGISGPHTANVVDQFPPARGFDNGNPADLEVPDGERMLHIIKAGEDGYMAVAQLVQGSETDTSFLRF
jgi:hypothetical protein